MWAIYLPELYNDQKRKKTAGREVRKRKWREMDFRDRRGY